MEKKLSGRELLSDFQQDKFRYFFYHVLDLNSDHVISEEDFHSLNDRVRKIFQISILHLKLSKRSIIIFV